MKIPISWLKLWRVYKQTKSKKNINVVTSDGFTINEQEYNWLGKNPENKWAEYLSYRYKFKNYPREQILKNFPPYVLLEPTSICNIRCVMCFQVDRSFSSNKDFLGRMPWDIFTKAVDEIADNNCNAITLASRGEPTLHPQLGEMLAYIQSKDILDVKLNTNATVLTAELARSILNAGVNEVVFSVDAGTKETYELIRVKGKFDNVVKNIQTFKTIRDTEYRNPKTTTRITGVKVRDDQDIDQMVNFWDQYVDEVAIKPASARWDSYNNDLSHKSSPCNELWERIYVWYDGTLNPCDFDYKSFLSPGNLRELTISEAWNSPIYNKIRQNHLDSKRSKCFPCDRCPF